MSENSRLATVEQYKHFKEIWRDNWNEALGLLLHPHWGVKMGQIAIVMPLALSSSSHLSPLLWQWSKKGLRYIQVTATAEMMSKFSKVKSHFHSKEQSEISFAKNDLIDFEGECLAQLSCQTQWHKYKFSYGMTFPPPPLALWPPLLKHKAKKHVYYWRMYMPLDPACPHIENCPGGKQKECQKIYVKEYVWSIRILKIITNLNWTS